MLREENIFIAKRMMVDNIYRSAKLEGLAVTFPQTGQILEDLPTQVKPSDASKIIALKRAWDYVLSHLDDSVDLALLKNIHEIIGRCLDIPLADIGEFRKSAVGISGTTWRPRVPKTEDIHQELCEILAKETPVERSIELFCWIMRRQMFLDGNKRVANLIANFELVRHGAGLLSVPEEHLEDFRTLLVTYYESGDNTELKAFLKYKSLYPDMEFLSAYDRQQ